MSTAPRVLYMGYGHAGVACLEELLGAGFDVAAAFCRASDRNEQPGDRASVFTCARAHGLACCAATDPNAPVFLAEAARLAPDLLLSVQYDRILKPPLLAVPRHGAFNLHFGPLPRLRGCFPTKWAILEDEPAGVTFHAIDPGIDSGDVVAQTIVPLAPGETDETLYRKLERAGIELFAAQIPWMRALSPPPCRPQDGAASSYHPKRLPFDGVIDWRSEAAWVERFLRAFTFPPYPAARTWHRGEEVQIRAPAAVEADLAGLAPGEFLLDHNGRLAVACGSGSLRVARVLLGGTERPPSALGVAPGEKGRFEPAPREAR